MNVSNFVGTARRLLLWFYSQLETSREWRFFLNFRFADKALAETSLQSFSSAKQIAILPPRLPPFCTASIHEGRVALSEGHPRGTRSRYVIGCCLIPLGIYVLKNNSRRITYGIGCVWGILLYLLYPLWGMNFGDL